MMWPLTVDAWTLAGRTIPGYPRDKVPVRVIRRGLNQDFREMLVALQGEGAAFLRMVDP